MCVGDVQCPKGVMTEAQKGLRERNICQKLSPQIQTNFRSQYFGAKKTDFSHSAEDRHPCKNCSKNDNHKTTHEKILLEIFVLEVYLYGCHSFISSVHNE